MIASRGSLIFGVGRSSTAIFNGEIKTTAFIVSGSDILAMLFARIEYGSAGEGSSTSTGNVRDRRMLTRMSRANSK